MNKDLPRLLRAIAGGTIAQENKHDIIFNAAADELERFARITPDARKVAGDIMQAVWLGRPFLADDFVDLVTPIVAAAMTASLEQAVQVVVLAKKIADPNPHTQRAYDLLIEAIRERKQ
jgi:hypothetical protein